MRLVFDLDECLVATREANRLAYSHVGFVVPRRPDQMYVPSSMWDVRPTPEQIEKKHLVFEMYLREYGGRLPALSILDVATNVTVLTGTSGRSVETIKTVFPELRGVVVIDSMTPDDKITWLNASKGAGVYFDDWSDMVQRVRRETRWQAIDVSGF